jgi:hypothetical protein
MLNINQKEYMVNKEIDVVVLRQALREIGRTLDLSLVQQVRITAAISDIARNVLRHHWNMVFTFHVHLIDVRRALDVLCQKPAHQLHPEVGAFEHQMNIDAARQLLDEATFSHAAGGPLLTLRIWIS